jgi:DNA invertase Pin-like site-specific DNA recombinase
MYILPDLKGKEIIMYLRKSRSDDPLATVEEVLAKHEQMLDEWMALHQPEGGQLPEANRLREVVSAETLEGRPKMMELLRRVESPDVKAVLVKEPSRLSRGSLKEIGYLVEVLMYTGTLVLTLQGSYDLRDDRDREQFERELMRGNDYLQYQKKILKSGKLLAVKNGNYIGSYAPYGYRKTSYKEGRTTCHTLEPIPEEAEVVKRIFEMYRQGFGAIKICDVLDAEHVKPPRGKKWADEAIYQMLGNVHYIGKIRWNYTQRGHRVEGGEVKTYKFTPEDYLIFEGKHPAIIDQELWDAVQDMRGKIPPKKKNTELRNPLAGILYCTCGRAMNYRQVQKKGVLIGLPRYSCGDPRCRRHASSIIAEVLQEVNQVLQECIDEFEVRIEQGVDNSAEIHKQTIARLEKKLQELRDLEIKQWDEKMKGGMPDHVFVKLNSQTVAEIEDITQALCEAKDSAPVHVDLNEKLVTFKTALALLDDPDAPVKEQNALLRACIERIIYSRPRNNGYVGKKGNPEPFKLEFTLRV